METKRLPLGIQTFENIRKDNYIYVDKTDLVYRLASESKFNFLSRPRRFGKSLLLSTLQAYFEGRKELFEGLKIASLEQDWTVYPVLRFDFNNGVYNDEEAVCRALSIQLERYESLYGISAGKHDISGRFEILIRNAYEKTGRQVVILVDEYEKPILESVNDPKLQARHRGYLKPFYGNLKSSEQYIRFALLTGVTKMGHLSVFSDLNNIVNQSLDPRYAAICGFTKEEISDYFAEYIDAMSAAREWTTELTIENLRIKYDGYRFSDAPIKVFNPYSLLNVFFKDKIGDYWFETGTPSFLVNVLRHVDFHLEELESMEVDSHSLTEIDDDYSDSVPLLYQSGYLTIKDYLRDDDDGRYIIGYPNEEVRRGFLNVLLPNYVGTSRRKSVSEIDKISKAVNTGEVEDFISRIGSLIMGIPSSPRENYEYFYRDSIYLIFKLLGFRVQSEVKMLKGCIDCVVETADYVYILEFKANSTVEAALKQIVEKGYAKPYEGSGKTLYCIGVNFNTDPRDFTYIIN